MKEKNHVAEHPCGANRDKELKIRLSEIKKRKYVFAREELNRDAVERYKTLYEQGKTKALIVQKGTKVLIDGFHRWKALRELGIQYVEVEEKDVPDSELLVEAYHMNKDHGVPINTRERNNLIVRLRFDEKRSLEEIARIVDLSVSAVKRVCDNFSIFSPKKAKVDLRKKVESEDIVKAFLKGIKKKEIAANFHISESRVSQVTAKYGKWKESGEAHIFDGTRILASFFDAALACGLFKTSLLEFRKEGVFVKKYDSRRCLTLYAFFPKDYFTYYDAKKDLDVPCREHLRDILDPRKMRPDLWNIWGESQIGLIFDKDYVRIQGTRSSYQKPFGDISQQKFPFNIPIDENGFVTDLDLKFRVNPWDFMGMGTAKDVDDVFHPRADMSLIKNDKLKVDSVFPNQWKASKVITPYEIQGEKFPFFFGLPSDLFLQTLRVCRNLMMANAWRSPSVRGPHKPQLQTWLCFNNFHENPRDRFMVVTSKSLNFPYPWFLHFIISGFAA